MGTAEKAPLNSEEKKKKDKLKSKADQAKIAEGLKKILEPNEQILAFTRGRIAGGWRGKLNVGPEAFFSPDVNLGLTERRIVLQHINTVKGTPSEHAVHSFPLDQLQSVDFSDLETFSADKACRIVLRLNRDQQFRIRVSGSTNFEDARNLADVFQTITKHHTSPQQRPGEQICQFCQNTLETSSKFCPFCGGKLELKSTPSQNPAEPTSFLEVVEFETVPENVDLTTVSEVVESETVSEILQSESVTVSIVESISLESDALPDIAPMMYEAVSVNPDSENTISETAPFLPEKSHVPSLDYGQDRWPFGYKSPPSENPENRYDDRSIDVNEDPPMSEFHLYTETTEDVAILNEEPGIISEQSPAIDAPESATPAEESAPSRSFWHQPEGEF